MKRAHIAALMMWTAAAILLANSLALGSWWNENGVRVGLTSITACTDTGNCMTSSFIDGFGDVELDSRATTFLWAGRLTFAFSLGVIAAIAASSYFILRRRRLGSMPVLIATLALLASMLAFVITFRGGDVGASFYLTSSGIALAIFGCFARSLFPIPEAMLPPPRPKLRPRRIAMAPGRAIAPPLRPLDPPATEPQPLRHHERPISSAPIGPWSYASPTKQPDAHPHARYAPPGLVLGTPAAVAAATCSRCSSSSSAEGAPFCGACYGYLLSGC
jgi:hypothetical protein